MGKEFQFGKMKEFWRWISGDGCTTLFMYLILLNCAHKIE